ncbi:protein YhfH [Savagea faecisuis]|uniref:Protein YhfH n=1 Tax=Savagea faecisuis TaxID=1274803 RepID=A0ABW3H5Q2_9BACL
MTQRIVQIFNDSRPKTCATCGTEIDELHNSYANECEACSTIGFIFLHHLY